MPASSSRPDIPIYGAPPVTEMLLSIQFATLQAFRTHHVGLLWNELRSDFPSVSEQMPLGAVFETFGASAPQPANFDFRMMLGGQLPRFWLESSDGETVLQIQRDRIAHNWRKRGDLPYPHYEPLRDRFWREVSVLEDFLQHENLGRLAVNQCEIAYINTIEMPSGENPHVNLHRIFPVWGITPEPPSPGSVIEDVGFQFRFILQTEGHSVGRLYVTCVPAYLPGDNRPAVQLQITARGRPQSESLEDAFKFLDFGRSEIVQAFDNVTSPELHRIWRKRENG